LKSFQDAKVEGGGADTAAGEGQALQMGRYLGDRECSVQVGAGDPVHDAVPALLDVAVFFPVIVNEGGRVIGEGPLPDLVGLGRDGLTGREKKKAAEEGDEPEGPASSHGT